MTFEQAVEILGPGPINVDYPKRQKHDPEEQLMIMVQFHDGTRARKGAFVRGNLGITKHQGRWYVIHLPSENGISDFKTYEEASSLVKEILRRRIDTNWGYRDLHVFKSISQLRRVCAEFRMYPAQLAQAGDATPPPQNGSGTASA